MKVGKYIAKVEVAKEWTFTVNYFDYDDYFPVIEEVKVCTIDELYDIAKRYNIEAMQIDFSDKEIWTYSPEDI